MKNKSIENKRTKIKAYKWTPYRPELSTYVIFELLDKDIGDNPLGSMYGETLESTRADNRVGHRGYWRFPDQNIEEIEYER